jgi:hypothetical protein
MQLKRRVGDRIDSLLKQALETDHPAPYVLSDLQRAILEYRSAKANRWRLFGRRRDDLRVVLAALSSSAVGSVESAAR